MVRNLMKQVRSMEFEYQVIAVNKACETELRNMLMVVL